MNCREINQTHTSTHTLHDFKLDIRTHSYELS